VNSVKRVVTASRAQLGQRTAYVVVQLPSETLGPYDKQVEPILADLLPCS
jgi:hypothetical protein